MRKKLEVITDALSPDFATCEHCGKPIAWDDWSYTHMNGFSDCDLTISGGTKLESFTLNPTLTPTSNPALIGKCAEPTTWFIDSAIAATKEGNQAKNQTPL